ncbi:putative Transmembrane protein [Quillaja saponaria]|uniref:Transmembrane protein n=1 Tax=Quillaja saponaria TaxID=32244 RepID=A0AAD7M439_QUISA|nr:putative Transmembrane protein [Quillaja saponaria]
MSLSSLMFRSLVRLLTSLIADPVVSASTILYYSRLLPQNIVLGRLVQHELLDGENYLFHFLINFLRCFW